jgi:hypothetical protein
MVVCDGVESTRERKLLAWAEEYAKQRSKVAALRAELARVGASRGFGGRRGPVAGSWGPCGAPRSRALLSSHGPPCRHRRRSALP